MGSQKLLCNNKKQMRQTGDTLFICKHILSSDYAFWDTPMHQSKAVIVKYLQFIEDCHISQNGSYVIDVVIKLLTQ